MSMRCAEVRLIPPMCANTPVLHSVRAVIRRLGPLIACVAWAGAFLVSQVAHASAPVTPLTDWARSTDGLTFSHPDGPRGWFKHGFRIEHDGSADWREQYGLRFEVRVAAPEGAELSVTLTMPDGANNPEETTARLRVPGGDWREITLPWTGFAFEQARTSFLKWVKGVRFAASVPVEIRELAVIRGDWVALAAPVRGRSGVPGGVVNYSVTVGNSTGRPQVIRLAFDRHGWEAMVPEVSPADFTLAAGESRAVQVQVRVPAHAPAGAHERQVLRATAEGNAARATTLEFVTAATLPHPNILHTPARWDEVRAKVKNHAWAREALAEHVRRAEAWQVPPIADPVKDNPPDRAGPPVFAGSAYEHEKNAIACGVAWQLTGKKEYAEKIAVFLRRLSDPERGYPVTWRGINQALVQEGHFFQHIAMAYDMALDAGVFSDADRAQIERTFRIFIATVDFETSKGSVNNWNLSEICGAFYCALALQDLALAERFYSGPSGLKDQLAKGTMGDGWWYECSISYNLWCASEFVQAGLAYAPWGVNFLDERMPADLSGRALLRPELAGGKTTDVSDDYGARRPFGMTPEIWGPVGRPWREIRDLWNGLLPFLDCRGVIFGVNDSTENSIVNARIGTGFAPFEMAYYVYRDPAYASVVKLAAQRDLLYGVPDLPAETPERFRDSAYADNVGLAMLRSQTPGRPMREQIQATLHYGIHGWAHGHFDRTGLLSLMRYGRSFYNPMAVWYVYEPFMYKFYTQNSVAKNMVVVDRKLQEAVESDRLLFHAGSAMQAAVVQTDTRWSNPPYGGMVYDYVPVKTFEEKQWREGRSVPLPEVQPAYGSLTDFTEKVLQRRLMVVTDDYVVVADWMQGGAEHRYESLFQMKGFQGLEGAGKKILRHDAQWETNPLGSAQFVTDCDWYAVTAPAKSRFEMRWGEKFGADNAGNRTPFSEEGILRLDVHSLWPQRQEIMVGTAPENHNTEKRLFHVVRGDGRVLTEGKVGAWILGQHEIDVSVDGISVLELETRVELSRQPTVFWGGARVVLRDGREILLSALKSTTNNVRPASAPDRDYFGGPVKIVGREYVSAVAAQPQDEKRAAVIRVDLAGLDAVRFKATLGSDYPLGDETQRRKTYAIRDADAPQAKAARFLTVIEPYEDKPVVKAAVALSADRLRVELIDGRVQEIELRRFEGDGRDIEVVLTESRDGVVLRTETTAKASAP